MRHSPVPESHASRPLQASPSSHSTITPSMHSPSVESHVSSPLHASSSCTDNVNSDTLTGCWCNTVLTVTWITIVTLDRNAGNTFGGWVARSILVQASPSSTASQRSTEPTSESVEASGADGTSDSSVSALGRSMSALESLYRKQHRSICRPRHRARAYRIHKLVSGDALVSLGEVVVFDAEQAAIHKVTQNDNPPGTHVSCSRIRRAFD